MLSPICESGAWYQPELITVFARNLPAAALFQAKHQRLTISRWDLKTWSERSYVMY
jgi:hypothetical protein